MTPIPPRATPLPHLLIFLSRSVTWMCPTTRRVSRSSWRAFYAPPVCLRIQHNTRLLIRHASTPRRMHACFPLGASMLFLMCFHTFPLRASTPFRHAHPHFFVASIHPFHHMHPHFFIASTHPFRHVHPRPFDPSCPCISNILLSPTYTLCSSTLQIPVPFTMCPIPRVPT